MYTNHNLIPEKKNVISILAKIWKTTFPKEILNEFWLIVRQYKYIYIAEIKMGFFFYFRGKTIFSAQPKMLIYAN